MLSTLQKAEILVRAGIKVPVLPPTTPDGTALPPKWRQDVDNLYAAYAAARAARSLRESEAARTMADLRLANNRMTHPHHPDDHDED
ncbi:hypothetical protein [uncultured Variovorax sp.]|jgi:hypothetical protein|uniref:hypothetical protein n=1 Tax=uncultured Variovorax sp. TaxID=114708 RepID=UPI0026168D85|nr:hypothetical protein [uncultured Variovorax sp.]